MGVLALRIWLVCVPIAPTITAAASLDDTIFVKKDLRWQPGHPELKYEIAVGSLTAFRKDGALVQIHCVLMRDTPTSPVMFDLKSGYSVQAGDWKRRGDKEIAVAIRLVAREKLAVSIGQSTNLPGPMAEEVWVLNGSESATGAGSIKTNTDELVPVSLAFPDAFAKLIMRYQRGIWGI